MALTPKQERFVHAFRTGKYKYLCAAGTAGSGKTVVTLGLLHLLCMRIPGVRFFVGRKSEKNLKQTTIPSYNEMKRMTNTVDESVVTDMVAKYCNGSEILFIWCDITKDPELNNVRGLEVNGGLFEEANQIDRKYFELAKIRIGRWRKELCKPFILLNLNPSIGWVKELFYDNWTNGTLPERHYFEEFDEQDARAAAGDEYVDGLNDLAKPEHDRFVKNKWDYSSIPNQLISYEWYKQCMRIENPPCTLADNVLGVTDPAWDGEDSTVFARMHNNHIGWWEEYPKQDPDFSGILAHQRIKEFYIKPGNWIVDPIGVGSATVLKLRNDLKYEPYLFWAGSPATNMFGVLEIFNQRSEGHWLLREAMRQEEITFTHTPEFQRQCLAVTYFLDDKKIRIAEKKEIKKLLNNISPGHLDCAEMLVHRWKTNNAGLSMDIFNRQIDSKTHVLSSRAARERAESARKNKYDQY